MVLDEQLFPKKQVPNAGPATYVNVLATRLKLAEGRYANLQKRNRLTEDALLAFEKEMKTELRVLTKQTVDLRRHISEINQKLDVMLGELSSVVQKHDFKALERYVYLWQPMNFVTHDEAKRMIGEKRG